MITHGYTNPNKHIKKFKFRDFMVMLVGPDTDQIQGCPVLFPDTAFFEDGKVSEIIRTDNKYGNLAFVKFDARSGIQDIWTSFTTIVRERRKEQGDISIIQGQKQEAGSPGNNGKMTKNPSNKQKSVLSQNDTETSPGAVDDGSSAV